MYKDERTRPRPVIREPPPIVVRTPPEPEIPPPAEITDRTYTKAMAIEFLKSRTRENEDDGDIIRGKVSQKTTNQHISRIDPLLRLFKVKNTDLMQIYDKHSVEYITATIVANPRWPKLNTRKMWVGFCVILAYDPRFSNNIGKQKSTLLHRALKTIRDDTSIDQPETTLAKHVNIRDIYVRTVS